MGTALVLLSALVTSGGTVADAAKAAVSELAAKAKGGPVVVAPLKVPAGDAAAAEAQGALVKALTDAKIRVVDPAAVQAAINEASVTPEKLDQALPEMVAALGAKMMVAGEVDKSGDSYSLSARLVSVENGTLLASSKQAFGSSDDSGAAEARTLEAQLRRLSDHLAQGLDRLPGEVRYQRFAIMPFEDVGEQTKEKQLGLLVASNLTTNLNRDHGLMIVERAQLTKVLEELSLGQTGATDPSKTAEIGKLAGAQALIVGTVSEAGDQYLVDARVVSVENGQIAFSTQGKLPAADLVALSSEAIELRTVGGSIYRSLLLPGWGQLYNRQGEKGAIFAGSEALAGLMSIYFYSRYTHFKDKYENPKPRAPEVFNHQLERERTYKQRTNYALMALLGIHAINVLDAFWNGKSFDNAAPGGG